MTASCGASTENRSALESGYVAGDGALTTWAPDQRPAPVEATGTTFEGDVLELEDLRGGLVLVNFWYAACPPCREEAPDLASIDADYPEDQLRLIGVNGIDDRATVTAFNATFGITYPSFEDSEAALVAAFEGVVPLRAMPTTVLLDSQGRPAARVVGLADGSTLRGLVDDLLSEDTSTSSY